MGGWPPHFSTQLIFLCILHFFHQLLAYTRLSHFPLLAPLHLAGLYPHKTFSTVSINGSALSASLSSTTAALETVYMLDSDASLQGLSRACLKFTASVFSLAMSVENPLLPL